MCEKGPKCRSCTTCQKYDGMRGKPTGLITAPREQFLQEQQKIILYGSHAIAAFLRLCDELRSLWSDDPFTYAVGGPPRCAYQEPPYELFCEESTMAHMLVVTVKATTMPMSDTLEALTRDLIAHGILDYEISMESLKKPVKPDPVTHARIR